jgi:hypothetical protein
MKKFLLLVLLVFLAACEQALVEVVPEMNETEPQSEVEDSKNEVVVEVVEEETIVQEPLITIQENLFIEEWFTTSVSNYVSFRILAEKDLRLYFKSGHEIRVIADLNVRDDQPFLIYEAVVAAGQFLGKFPLSYVQSIDQVMIYGSNSSFNTNGNQATVGVNYLTQNYNNQRAIQGMVLPLLEEEFDSIRFDGSLWEELTLEINSYEPFDGTEPIHQIRETYYALNLKTLDLLSSDFLEELEPYMTVLEESFLPESHQLFASNEIPAMPNNMTLNIQMGEFYDVIPDDAPSTFVSLEYNEIKQRYYPRIDLPAGCYSPPECPRQAIEYDKYPWQVHQFTATFSDGSPIEFNVPSDTEYDRAEFIAREFAIAYGRVTGILRTGVKAVLVLNGRGNAWGGPYHGYGTTLTNCGECNVFEWNKLEELIMHELVHSTIDYRKEWIDHITGNVDRSGQGMITMEEWDRLAVQKDGFSMDQRSIDIPNEDRAQTMLFYAALRLFPESTTELTKLVIQQLIPNRIAVFDELLGFN